jgi:vanillate O-demethylase monooxygenase subunit
MEITIGDRGVTVWRWLLDTPAPPFYAPYLPFTGNCDRKQEYEVRYPSNALITAVFTPAGSGGEQRPHTFGPHTFVMDSYNFLTPVDEHTTRYFWFQTRNVAPDDAQVSAAFAASVKAAFAEDKVVLEAVQRGMDAAVTPGINLRSDTGGARFRRRHAELVAAEQP